MLASARRSMGFKPKEAAFELPLKDARTAKSESGKPNCKSPPREIFGSNRSNASRKSKGGEVPSSTKSHTRKPKFVSPPRDIFGSNRSNASLEQEKKLSKTEIEQLETELDCMKRVPSSAISYSNVTHVVTSWEKGVKTIPNWAAVTGECFLRKIFELDPTAIKQFGFTEDTNFDDPSVRENDRFIMKAMRIIKAIDMAVSFMGPDLSLLEAELFNLGGRHGVMNVRPHQWPLVGEALFYAFEMCMKETFNGDVRKSWTIVYNFLGYHMIQGLLDKYPHFAEPVTPKAPAQKLAILDCTERIQAKSISFQMVSCVIKTWDNELKSTPNWATVTGELFLRKILERGGSGANVMFGFPIDTKHDDPALSQNKKFMDKGVRLIQAIDMAVSFLGPDLEPLETELFSLGRRHVALGCKPSQWPMVGEALFDVFEQHMGKDGAGFTPQVRNTWTIIYNFLGYHMIQGLVDKCPALKGQ